MKGYRQVTCECCGVAQDILLALAKAVANTTAALVLKAKHVAAQCRDQQPLQNSIIAAATHCALATSQLVACAKVTTSPRYTLSSLLPVIIGIVLSLH